jgi:hypothetical protein
VEPKVVGKVVALDGEVKEVVAAGVLQVGVAGFQAGVAGFQAALVVVLQVGVLLQAAGRVVVVAGVHAGAGFQVGVEAANEVPKLAEGSVEDAQVEVAGNEFTVLKPPLKVALVEG